MRRQGLEQLARSPAEKGRDDDSRDAFDHLVPLGRDLVIEGPRCRELLFERSELAVQVHEQRVGGEFGVAFFEREQAAHDRRGSTILGHLVVRDGART